MINLLPPQEKEKINQKQINRIVMIWTFIILVFLLALALNLSAVNIQLKNKIKAKQIITDNLNQELKNPRLIEADQEIKSLNKLLSTVKKMAEKQSNVSFILEKLARNLPPNSYLLRFNYEPNNGLIEIKGFSPTRQELLQLKNNLEQDGYFSNVEFPPSNWLETKNIEFTAKLTISQNGD